MPKMSFSGESDNPGYRSEPHVTDSGESDTWRDTEEREREGDVGSQRNGKSEEKPEVQNGRYQGCRQRVWRKGEENPLKLLTSKGSHGADDGSRNRLLRRHHQRIDVPKTVRLLMNRIKDEHPELQKTGKGAGRCGISPIRTKADA